jgi:hypothetical protein
MDTNFAFCCGQQPKPQIVCCVFSGLVLADAGDSITKDGLVQAQFCTLLPPFVRACASHVKLLIFAG